MKNDDLNNKTICNDTESLIDDYIEGMISLKDKEIMDEHISTCEDCSKYFKDTSELVKKLNALPANISNLDEKRKTDLWKNVESNIKNQKSEKDKDINNNRGFLSKYKYYLGGIAAIFLIAIGVYAVKNLSLKDVRMAQNTFGLPTYWKVASLTGSPMIGDNAMQAVDSIKEGQWIWTNDSSSAELLVSNIGTVTIEPNSKVIFVKGADGNNRILVEYGTINADMNSQPNTFYVEMPSAVASDKGGAYILTIDSTGDGLVYVKSGKVEVQSQNKGAIVPAGSLVMTKKELGVGTPFNENSSPKFKNALFNFDFGDCSGSCVSTLLGAARMSDAVTLVNLIPNVENQYKDEVYTKLARFVAPPAEVHADSIYFFDEDKLNEWVDKIQVEVRENVERSIKDVEKNLEHLKKLDKINFDSLQALENFAKNWKFKIKPSPKGTYIWNDDTLAFDQEQFKKDMEEMQKNINENSKIDKEQLKEDMQNLQEDLKEMKQNLKENLDLNNEELKKELEKAKDEIKKAIIEVDKIPKVPGYDSGSYHHKIKVYPKDNDDENDIEETKTPEAPQEPGSDVNDK